MKKVFLIVLISLFTAISVNAADDVLQSVQIEPLNDSYNIVLVADNAVTVKKTVQAPNRIILSLKGIRASKTLNTVYKNVSNVDNVIVEPTGLDGLSIMLQGENASNATVTFDSMFSSVKVDQKANPKKEILLNAPINTFTPIYKNDSDNGPSLFGNIDVHYILSGLKKALSGNKTVNLLTLGMFGLIFLLGVKLIKGKDNDISVGLSQGLRERDESYTKNAAKYTPGYKPTTKKPYTTTTSNYGLKAYQESTQSPFLSHHTTTTGHTLNNMSSPLSSNTRKNMMADSIGTPKRTVSGTVPQRTAQTRPASNTMTQPKAKAKTVDSVKFLESMSAIYEKSGRPDLADGIRTKLNKISK